MAEIEYHVTDRDRVCKMCDEPMMRMEKGLVIRGVRVSPKIKDLHFHEGCLLRAVDNLRTNKTP